MSNGRIFGVLVMSLAVAGLIAVWPDIRRYIKISSM